MGFLHGLENAADGTLHVAEKLAAPPPVEVVQEVVPTVEGPLVVAEPLAPTVEVVREGGFDHPHMLPREVIRR